MIERFSEQSTSQVQGRHPVSWWMPLAALLLTGLLMHSDGEGESESPDDRSHPTNRTPVRSVPESADGTSSTQPREKERRDPAAPKRERRTRFWPKFSLDEALRHNPFADPNGRAVRNPDGKAGAEKKTAETQRVRRIERLNSELEDERVRIVFSNEQGTTAVIGSRVVRVGDRWEHGTRIVEIGPKGVIVEVDDTESSP